MTATTNGQSGNAEPGVAATDRHGAPTAPASCPCRHARGVRATILLDLARYTYHLDPRPSGQPAYGPGVLARVALFFPGFFAVLLYRVAHLLHARLPGPLGLASRIPTRLGAALTGVNFSPAMHAGPGLMVNHTGNIHLGPVSLGSNCNIAHGVTIGQTGTDDRGAAEVPSVGDRVWIGPNAVVVGQVHLGHDCAVSALSLVTTDVPARALVIGVPGRVVSGKGSFRQIRYYGMDDDLARLDSLRQVTEQEVGPPRSHDSQDRPT